MGYSAIRFLKGWGGGSSLQMRYINADGKLDMIGNAGLEREGRVTVNGKGNEREWG